MTENTEVKIPVSGIGIRHKARASIALIGNPNAGKSTLFNRLTGLRQTTANFPGVTVEKHQGTVQLANSAFNLIDLPGIYSLDGNSADERIAVDVTLGLVDQVLGIGRTDVVTGHRVVCTHAESQAHQQR